MSIGFKRVLSLPSRIKEHVVPVGLSLPPVRWRGPNSFELENWWPCRNKICWIATIRIWAVMEDCKWKKNGTHKTLSIVSFRVQLLGLHSGSMLCVKCRMDNAFKFDEKTGGLCSEEDYPYEAKQNKICNTNCTDVPGTIVRTFYDVPPGDAKAMLAAIALQPISVAIQADQFVFQFYKDGVLTDSNCGAHGDIDHGVLAVGYGTDLETQQPYYLVKNSWGASWGMQGYIKLGRNTTNEFGICSILKMASYPEVE